MIYNTRYCIFQKVTSNIADKTANKSSLEQVCMFSLGAKYVPPVKDQVLKLTFFILRYS